MSQFSYSETVWRGIQNHVVTTPTIPCPHYRVASAPPVETLDRFGLTVNGRAIRICRVTGDSQ